VTYSESDLWAHLIGAVFTLLMLIICTVEDSSGCVGACSLWFYVGWRR
jgi:hypothetical protein